MDNIVTQRLVIRRFTAGDWKDLYDYLSDENVVKFEPYETFTEKSCQKEAAQRAKMPEFLAVCLKETGKLIGNLYFIRISPADFGTWELGYVFSTGYQGQGYATESCRALIDFAFFSMHARRIAATCDPENIRSWRLLERLGMRREAHLRQDGFFKRDAQGRPLWHDTYEYAVLADEWKPSEK